MAIIKMTLEQLESLLNEQKRLTVEKCLGHNYYYNKESTEGHARSLPIDEIKFREQGMKAEFPQEFKVLEKYLAE